MESRLLAILQSFEREVEGVRGSAVADQEGLPIANGFKEPLDLTAVAAMSTHAIESSRKVFSHIGLKGLKTIALDGEDAKVVVYDLGAGRASFIAVVRPETPVGLLKLHMALAAKRLEEELGITARSGAQVEELFLITKAGLLIAHRSRSAVLTKDRDIMAGMLTAVQAFVKDAFGDKGETLEEMKMAQLRVRLVRGRWSAWAVVATGEVGETYIDEARKAIAAFEQRNREALDPWNGELGSLRDVDDLVEYVFSLRP